MALVQEHQRQQGPARCHIQYERKAGELYGVLEQRAPIVPANMLYLAGTVVHHQSRSGQIIGPHERVSPYIVFTAMTD